ncbi:MAG: hypothetical protein ACFFB2_15390 [Promethearchaeota archaeon]
MLNLFISYSEKDKQSWKVLDFIEEIKTYSDFDRIILCETDRDKDSLCRCLNFSNNLIDVCIFFCSEEAQNVIEMCEEVNLAFNSGLEIIPIYENYSNVFPIIRHKRGVRIVKNKFNPQDVVKDVIEIIKDEKEGRIANQNWF